MRLEIYRPQSGRVFVRACTEDCQPGAVRRTMADLPPGSFALILRIDGDEQTVLERWRVDSKGRVLRALFDVRERELEQ